MKKRILSIVLAVCVMTVFSATSAFATTISAPDTAKKGASVKVTVTTEDFIGTTDNYCRVSVYSLDKNGLLVLEQDVPYQQAGQVLTLDLTFKDKGDYAIYASAYHLVNGFVNWNMENNGGRKMYFIGNQKIMADCATSLEVKAVSTPKATSVTSLTAVSKGFTVKWKKVTCKGYQVRYSVNSNMKNAKKVTISKPGTTSKTVKNLKAKKKYYVQVRTYKVVDGNKVYSKWTKAKAVTTKK
ncbi:MAG: fibronectin type III domain-containing protein [Clostridia bacterium]|nr:fibronectin type III domain-containing protein [Clostridia bacterium]